MKVLLIASETIFADDSQVLASGVITSLNSLKKQLNLELVLLVAAKNKDNWQRQQQLFANENVNFNKIIELEPESVNFEKLAQDLPDSERSLTALLYKSNEYEKIAKVLGIVAISLKTKNWAELSNSLLFPERLITLERNTKETKIKLTLDLDTPEPVTISTGLGFFDHMLEQIAKHAGFSMDLKVAGDLDIDEHHSIEDTGILIGQAILQALADKRGIERYAYVLPMDEVDAQVVLDFAGRFAFDWQVEFKREKIGEVPTEMFKHFFLSLAEAAKMNLHIKAEGENEHHKIEAVFKAFGRALKQAVFRDTRRTQIPSTKGVL